MTKKEAKARKEAWTKALSEGRVVRVNDGSGYFKSYLTQEAAESAREYFTRAGLDAEIVSVPRQ